jgi:hypothetical protein
MNGEAVPNPQREGSAECVSPDGAKVLCCSWQNTPFSQAYMGAPGQELGGSAARTCVFHLPAADNRQQRSGRSCACSAAFCQ